MNKKIQDLWKENFKILMRDKKCLNKLQDLFYVWVEK